MKEIHRITNFFKDAYNGDPWLDVSLRSVLESITPAEAATNFSISKNSIWEIVNHIISWRLNVLQRLRGEILQTPEHNYFLRVPDTSDAAWNQTLHNLEHSQEIWVAFLNDFDKKNFRKIYAGTKHSYYELLMGIIQHDAYHLGQVVMLAKSIQHTA